MSNRWWEKRRKNRHSWLNIFYEFDRIEKMMDEMMSQTSSYFRRPFESTGKGKRFRPHVYGFSITIGPDGRPRIREFGNVQRSLHGPRIREQREPLVDVLDEEQEVVVVAELPGVEKDDIDLQAFKGGLTISVDTPQRKYHTELQLPEEADPKPVKTSYKNGVLEVRFKKKGKEKELAFSS